MGMLISITILLLLFSLRAQGIDIPGICFGLTIGAMCINAVITIWKAGKEYQRSQDGQE